MTQYLYGFRNVYLNVFSLGQPNITPPDEIASQFQAMAFRDPDAFASQNLPECEVYVCGVFDDLNGILTPTEKGFPTKICDLGTVYKAALRAKKAKQQDMEAFNDGD